MEKRPTKKQKELLNFIDRFIKSYGYGPSYREIMRGLDYKSVSTVATHVNGLIARGWLMKKENSARTLELRMPTDDAQPEVASRLESITPHKTAEQEILAKIAELRKQKGNNTPQVETLCGALVVLGYQDPRAKTSLA